MSAFGPPPRVRKYPGPTTMGTNSSLTEKKKPLGTRTNNLTSKTNTTTKRKAGAMASSVTKKAATAKTKGKGKFTQNRLSSDYKGRLEDLQKEFAESNKEIAVLKATIETSSNTNLALNANFESLSTAFNNEQRVNEENVLTIESRNKEIDFLKEANVSLESQLSDAIQTVKTANEGIASRDITIIDLTQRLQTTTANLVESNDKINEAEVLRRKLHNTIQEMKGNIRVFCRVRPTESNSICHMSDEVENKKIAVKTESSSVSGAKKNKTVNFNFDRVFSPATEQQDVFNEVSHLVQSSLDGYNVCIFAYGQTGSGKTHTMEGGATNNNAHGVIPRSVEKIFAEAKEMKKTGWEYTFEASYVEIYNETIRDLLSDSDSDPAEKKEVRGDGEISNVTLMKLENTADAFKLLKKAAKVRTIGKTKLNAQSSRSHSVFRLKISGKNDKNQISNQSTINLVDLAGSERVEKSGATGPQLTEAQNINKSLSNLGTVISSLANKSKHVPFRNSKLTHVLQSSLGGSSKCLMMCCVAPTSDSANETINSLRFATRVNECVVGTAAATNVKQSK